MKAKVTEKGLIIPKKMLKGIEEVEILKKDHQIIVLPITQGDPIFDLGKHPVECGLPDASECHDSYLHNS